MLYVVCANSWSLLLVAFSSCDLLDVEFSQAAKEAGARRGTVCPFKRCVHSKKSLHLFLPTFNQLFQAIE